MKKKMRKLIALLLASVVVFSLLAGCGDKENSSSHDDSIVLATSSEPVRFYANGPDGSNANDFLVLNNIYDPLVFLDADGTIKPCLAEEWTLSEDGKCYTFTLRKGVKFHDGSDMTAEDVVFSFDVAVQNSVGKGSLINYDHSEVVDERTVSVYLTDPYDAFLNGCASRAGGITSKAYYEKVGVEGYLKAPIGTGPYKFVSAVSGDNIILEAFEDYWNGPAAIKNVTIKIMTDASTQIIALENGDIDAIRTPDLSSCLSLNEASGVTWDSGDSVARVTMYISANEGRLGENTDFRKAVQYAVNKKDVIAGCTEGYATQIDIDMCPSYAGHPEGYKVVKQDVEKAKEYLVASGYNDEEFEIIAIAGTITDKAAQIIQAQLMEIGINCKVNAVDNPTFNELHYGGNYSAMIRSTNSSLMDADGFLNYFMGLEANYAATVNNQYPRTQEIYEIGMKARKAQGEERKELYRQAVDICTDEAYTVPLFANISTMAYRTDLKGVKVYPLGVVYFYDLSW